MTQKELRLIIKNFFLRVLLSLCLSVLVVEKYILRDTFWGEGRGIFSNYLPKSLQKVIISIID